MKKKILLISLMIALFACVFAFSVNAELIALDTDPGLNCDDSLVSTFDYDAFNNSTAPDKESRVVMTDGTKFYVFPSYYMIWGPSYGYSFDNLNKAIKASDSNITSDMFTSAKTQLVRVQLPSSVTQITGTKFENHTALKEVIFSESFTGITCMDAFGGCSNLEYISSIENFTQIGAATFTGCNKLEIDVIWPSAITSVPSRVFQNCNKIKSIAFSDGLISVGEKAFQGCNSITEIVLPNTVTTVYKHSFGTMASLKTLNFGAGFTTFASSNYDFETTQGSNALKYVYLPAGIYANVSTFNPGYGRHIFGDGKTNMTFFFTGDMEEAQNLKDHFAKIGNNAEFAGATLVEYDPNRNYEGYADTLGYNIVVYNYNKCEAFYNGEHKMSDVTYELPKNYISNAYDKCVCTQCQLENIVKTYNPIISLIGFSAKEDDKKVCMTYKLDKEAIEKYEAETGKELSIGVTAAADFDASLTEYEPMNSDLTPIGKAIVAPVNKAYGSFDFVLSGFTAEHYAKALVMCAYVSDGTAISYIDTDCKSKATVFTFAEKIA